MNEMKKAVVTVLGIDSKGIIARVSTILFENDANILDISQTVLADYLTWCSWPMFLRPPAPLKNSAMS